MREKLLAKLKIKFPGLPASFLGLWADKMAVKVTEDSQIEGAINELDNLTVSLPDLATNFQKESDRRVTEAEKKWKETHPASTDPKSDPTPGNDPKPADPNAALAKKVDDLTNLITNMQKQSTQKSLGEKLIQRLTDKKIPLSFAKGKTIEKVEDLDTVLTEIETDYTDVKQGFIDQGLLSSTPPVGGLGGPKIDNADADIKAWAAKTNPEPAKVDAK
jgi:hypothetical protein